MGFSLVFKHREAAVLIAVFAGIRHKIAYLIREPLYIKVYAPGTGLLC